MTSIPRRLVSKRLGEELKALFIVASIIAAGIGSMAFGWHIVGRWVS